jgi:murein DD-endopeptidase MepM/ murein hydrolase activator NlpD
MIWMTPDYRYGYFVKESKTLHTGLDIPAEEGSPVFATAEGEVIFSGYGILYGSGAKNDPYGIVVKIRHTQKYNNLTLYSMYAHLGRTAVKVGDQVTAGQTIGYVGMTGNTSGPHLHYETRILGENGQVTQNPELWLVPPLDHGVLAGES